MRYNLLGNTGLSVSTLSFGASSLGGVFHEIDEKKAIEAVHVALSLGINYIDVAPAYGGTLAETILGKALKEVPRNTYFISTKVGKNTNSNAYGSDTFIYSEEGIRRSLDESSKRIGVDYFDLVLLHDIEYNNRQHTDWALNEGIQTLNVLKSEGRIGATGIGMYPVDLWKEVLESCVIDVALTHNLYCIHDTRLLSLLPIAKKRGVGIINASPFASGLLTSKGAPSWHPANTFQRALFAKAAAFCKKNGVDISTLALQFSAQNPEITTTMFSSANAETIKQNVNWFSEPINLELLQKVQEILAPISNQNWNY
ncbi:MAG: aldo/keto reductase [Saprospiraceae bacterium]|nr:aldo/keto reductase [Saprospiraceae bacterium]